MDQVVLSAGGQVTVTCPSQLFLMLEMTTMIAIIIAAAFEMMMTQDTGPSVRLRADGVVERFDNNEFRFKPVPAGSMFKPVPAGRLPLFRSRSVMPAPTMRRAKPGERFQQAIPQFVPKGPRTAAPGRFDA